MTTTIRADWSHARACQRAARLLRELDGIGDGMSLDGVAAMLIADDLDEVAERIRKSYVAEQDQRLPQWKRRKFRAHITDRGMTVKEIE